MTPIQLKSEADTLAFGARLANLLRPGDTVALSGGLGAGKTTLARGLIQSRHVNIDVPSPTYTLVQTYDWGDGELWHCDLYRLEQPSDAYELGLIDAMGEELLLIEWSDKLGELLPPDHIRIDLSFDRVGRRVEVSGLEDRGV